MASALFDGALVLVRGGGDLATGVVYRVVKAGFPVVVMELARPLVIRRPVALASAVFEGRVTVEGLAGCLVQSPEEVAEAHTVGAVPVLVDPDGTSFAALRPDVIVDARLAKRPLDTVPEAAPLVIGLGPGFEAGVHCHAVIETNRGHTLGRVIWAGAALADTGTPGRVQGRGRERVLRAPVDGTVQPLVEIGTFVKEGQPVCSVAGQPVLAPFDGVVRGLIHPSVPVRAGLKIGDVDPRGEPSYCWTISEKALAVGGGVVEAIFSAPQMRPRLAAALNPDEN